MIPSHEQILAASSPWLAGVLNVVPGLGTGYIYQRRWRAYWITSGLGVAWFVLGAWLDQDLDPVLQADLIQQNQLLGLGGLVLLAGVSSVEAVLAARRVREPLDPA
ncbi:MAG: hypothetical protein VKK98_03875 [Cyanobacteriota bacterium]|nr:hypothetical protein [Cyanobacteriota bacterium]